MADLVSFWLPEYNWQQILEYMNSTQSFMLYSFEKSLFVHTIDISYDSNKLAQPATNKN
jgi:hypothetical protein